MGRFLLALALATALFQTANAQTTVATVPVGFNTANIPAATDANTPSNTAISTSFYAPALFQGAVSSVDSSNQVSLSGASFTAGQLTSSPYLARFKTGASTGRFFVITGNTSTQLTLNTNSPTSDANGAGYTLTTSSPSNSQTQVAIGDQVEVLPANTFGSLFGTVPVASGGTMPFKTGTATTGDNIYLWDLTATPPTWVPYFHNGTSWRRSGSGLNQNNTIILPDRGMFVIHRDTNAAITLTFLGTVPSTTEKTDFLGPGSTFKANRFPVDTTILGLGLQSLPGWGSGATATTTGTDNLYLWNGTTWNVYFYNGTNWKRSGSGLNQNTTPVPTGSAIFVVRQTTATGSNSTLAQSLPYSF